MKSKSLPKAHGVKLNFIMNAILKMSAFIFPLITFPYVSRILGATGNGKITFATSVISYFSMFAQLGIPTYGIRTCASCRNDVQKLNQTVQELLIINTITVIASYVVFAFALVFVPRFQTDRTLMIITSATILLNAIGMDWLFQALEQYTYITVRNLAFKVLSIIMMFAMVHDPEDYVIYGAISVIGSCGSNVLNMIYASRFLEHKRYEHYNLKQHLKPILTFFMLSVSISVYTHMDSVMLGFMSTDAEVGYYSAATKMKTILVSAITALGAVLLPRMSIYIAQGKIQEFYSTIKKSFNFIFVVSISATIYFALMAEAVIGFLAGDGYIPAIVPMQIISATVVLISLSNITGMQVLVPTNRERYTTSSTVVGAVVNLIVNALAIPRLGASGAAIGTVAAEASVLFVQVVILRKELPQMLKGIQIFKILIGNAAATALLIIVKNNFPISNYFLQLVVTAIVFFGVYGIILLILREKFVFHYFFMYLNKIKEKVLKGKAGK